jgi:hypothetical protein
MKRIVAVVAAVLFLSMAFSFSNCGSAKGNYLVLDKGEISLLSFSLDRTLHAERDSSIDQGPASQAEAATYWVEHQKAVDAMYGQFKERIPAAFLGAPFFQSYNMWANRRYLELTAPRTTEGGTMMPATGTRWVSPYDSTVLDSLCDLLGVKLILSVQAKAFYRALDSVHIVNNGPVVQRIPLGSVVLSVTLFLHEKGCGMVWKKTFSNLLPASLVDLSEKRAMKKEDYAGQLTSALEGIYGEITAEAKRGRAYAAKQK